jgi:iron(III) transport system ATP-binding protein
MNETKKYNQGTSLVDVRLKDINLSFGDTHVLKGIDLHIKPGEFFAFLGPSGCGKTTLLRLIAGFEFAQTGQVSIGGNEISHLPPWKRNLGMVFQSYALWPHMTVFKNVSFGLEERKFPRKEIRERVEKALDLVGLKSFAERRPSQLSGGQQQRVALARTIVVEPKVLLLDEPLSNLDAKLRVQMRLELRELQQKLSLTTIFVTHDQEEANTTSDRIAVINEGVVQQVGRPEEIYDQPANLFVAKFLGVTNVVPGTLNIDNDKMVFCSSDGMLTVPMSDGVKGPGNIIFRPQNLTLLDFNAPPVPDTIRLDGIVQHKEFLGSIVRYQVKTDGYSIIVDTPHQRGDAPIQENVKVALYLKQSQITQLAH